MPKHTVQQKVDVLNIRLPDDIISWIDGMISEGLYSSRSEIIRDIIRDFVNEVSQ